MAGKGSKMRTGANPNKYWNNFPFPERLTITQWKNKMGDDIVFDDIPPGTRITESEYLEKVAEFKQLSEKDIEEFKDAINSMGYSEFTKFTKH